MAHELATFRTRQLVPACRFFCRAGALATPKAARRRVACGTDSKRVACPTIRLLHSGNPKARREISVGRGWVAQLAEQRTENPRVGGSIPPPAIPPKTRRVQQFLQQKPRTGRVYQLRG